MMLVEVWDFFKLFIICDMKYEIESEILSKINVYELFFFCQIFVDKYWKILVDFVYCEMIRMKLKILFVVRKRFFDCLVKIIVESLIVEIIWFLLVGIGKY